MTAPIVGATDVRHLEAAAAASEIELSSEEIEKLEAAYVPHRILGHAPPSPRSMARDEVSR